MDLDELVFSTNELCRSMRLPTRFTYTAYAPDYYSVQMGTEDQINNGTPYCELMHGTVVDCNNILNMVQVVLKFSSGMI